MRAARTAAKTDHRADSLLATAIAQSAEYGLQEYRLALTGWTEQKKFLQEERSECEKGSNEYTAFTTQLQSLKEKMPKMPGQVDYAAVRGRLLGKESTSNPNPTTADGSGGSGNET